MKIIKKFCQWFLFTLLVLIALGSIPSFAFVAAGILALLAMPVAKWQAFISKYVKRKVKRISIAVLTVLMFFTLPAPDPVDVPPEASPAISAVTSTTAASETGIAPDTEPPCTEANTVPVTEPAATSDVTDTVTDAPSEAMPDTMPDTQPPAAATQTMPETTAEPQHIHSFSEATCTAPKTCACGATEGSANGHTWIEADCTTAKTCSVCSITEGSANGHSWKDATYSAPKTCTNCGITEGSSLEKPGGENYHGHVYTGGSSSKKFHYEENCAGKYSHEITWDEVERRNLGPCGTCVLK